MVGELRPTVLLQAAARGDARAADQLFGLVYDELRSIASGSLRRVAPGISLQPTEVVHEVWMRLMKTTEQRWNDSRHFIATAALSMRQVAVDWARRRRAAKRGGDDRRVPLDETIEALRLSPDDVLTIDEALNELAAVDPRAAKLVTMRYFLGLGDAEIADALGVTDRTVRRDWTFARAWLHRRLEASFVEPATPPCP